MNRFVVKNRTNLLEDDVLYKRGQKRSSGSDQCNTRLGKMGFHPDDDGSDD